MVRTAGSEKGPGRRA